MITEAEGRALLRKLAPHWREHLRDPEVMRHVIYQVKPRG